jgi:hypothetical protein
MPACHWENVNTAHLVLLMRRRGQNVDIRGGAWVMGIVEQPMAQFNATARSLVYQEPLTCGNLRPPLLETTF